MGFSFFPPQESCLRRLLEGLLIYSVLLKHVEEEYPLSRIPAEVRYYSSILIKEVENKVGRRCYNVKKEKFLEKRVFWC